MLRERVIKLLKDIDDVERKMRGLESNLTTIRVQIRRELLYDPDAEYVTEAEQRTKR